MICVKVKTSPWPIAFTIGAIPTHTKPLGLISQCFPPCLTTSDNLGARVFASALTFACKILPQTAIRRFLHLILNIFHWIPGQYIECSTSHPLQPANTHAKLLLCFFFSIVTYSITLYFIFCSPYPPAENTFTPTDMLRK